MIDYFEIQKYYQNKPKFSGVYPRSSLPNDEVYVTTFDKYKSIGTYWIALCVNSVNLYHFDSFEIKYILNEKATKIWQKIFIECNPMIQ